MNIKEAILNKVYGDGQITVRDLLVETGLTRGHLQRYFKELCDEGKIYLVGKANQSRYVLAHPAAVHRALEADKKIQLRLKNDHLAEDEVYSKIKTTTGILVDLPENIEKIVQYAFTEMLNNSIDHSGSDQIQVKVERLSKSIHFSVFDEGIGIFQNIMEKKQLSSILDAIGELLKGKQTTAPQAHSGEGIFFTSKVADRLVIKSSQKRLIFDNLLNDVAIENCSAFKGTRVLFAISLATTRRLEDIFKDYSNEAFEFSKTQAHVRLYQMGQAFVSRSQARRILSGLESFETVILDFKGVKTVGQGFADEIFRVWKNRFPDKSVIIRNSNENIDFMIERGKI